MLIKWNRRINNGSVTLEACLTIPLFLFFFFSIASIIMTFFGEAHIHQSLATAGEVISRNYYSNQPASEDTVSDGMYYLLLNKQFSDALGDDFFVNKVVSGGKKGIVLSYIPDNENSKIFYLHANYLININIPVIGRLSAKRTVTIKQKGFVGYKRGEEAIDPYVYITPNQAVYHCSRSCTHLSLSVRTIDGNNRNLYKPCGFCRYEQNDCGKIYVARTSDLYHESRTCSGLKRSVTRVKKSMVPGLPPCERCGR